MKTAVSKEKVACPRGQRLRGQYLNKKLRVRLVNDYADTRFSNLAMEYLRENKKGFTRTKKFAKLFLSVLMGPRSNLLSQIKW